MYVRIEGGWQSLLMLTFTDRRLLHRELLSPKRQKLSTPSLLSLLPEEGPKVDGQFSSKYFLHAFRLERIQNLRAASRREAVLQYLTHE